MAPLDVLFIVDPPETFSPTADTTYVMVQEALRRGHHPFAAQLEDLALEQDRGVAAVTELAFDGPTLRRQGDRTWRPLSDFAVVLMRKDPPVDQGFVTATWILDHAGTTVINHPAGLRHLNEKLSTAPFSSFIPKTFVSRDADHLRAILNKLGGKMIIKPVFGFGGREVLIAQEDDPNLSTLFELATADGTRWTIAQEYLPAAKQGDKRILLVDGEPIGAVLRVGAMGEIRNNFHAGGSPELTEITPRDRQICQAIAPTLLEHGQFFVGIDVIGDRLTEINVTSPTGMQEINRLGGLEDDHTMQAVFWQVLEQRLGANA